MRFLVHGGFRRLVHESGGETTAVGDGELETDGGGAGVVVDIVVGQPDEDRGN